MADGKRQNWLELLVVLLAMGIVSFLLFVPPVVGLADQADFARLIEGAGLAYPVTPPGVKRFFCFLEPTYRIVPLSGSPYASSASIFVVVARILNRAIGHFLQFDIRMLGFVYLLSFAGTIYLLMRCSRGLSFAGWTILAVSVLFIGCDVGYVDYFNSFYQEPATYLFGLAYIIAVVALVEMPFPRFMHAVFVFVALLLFVAAKPQNLPLLPAAAPFFVFGLKRVMPSSLKWNTALAAGVMVLCCWAAYGFLESALSERIQRMNLYNSIFLQVLPHSTTPAADLTALGLDPQLARYSGSSAFIQSGAFYHPTWFPREASYGRLVRFYLARPARLFALTERGVEAALSNRVAMLGNYLRSTGKPCATLSSSFSWWDSLRKHLRNLWFVAGFMALNILAPFIASLRVKDPRTAVLLQFQSSMAWAAVLLFYAAIVGDGNEFQKHLFAFNFLFDACLVADVLWIVEGGYPARPHHRRTLSGSQ
jgi:hypothetical protein